MCNKKPIWIIGFLVFLSLFSTSIQSNASPVIKTQINSFTVVQTSNNIEPGTFFVGSSYKITAGATSSTKPMYKFWTGDLTTGKWTVLRDYSENNSIIWTAPYVGKFELYVQVKDAGSTAVFDDFRYSDITVQKPTSSIQNFTIKPTSSYTVDPLGYYLGRTYKISTGATSTNKSMYKFWMSDLNKGNWVVLKDYSEISSINWTAPYAGKFELYVQVRDIASTATFDTFKYSDITVQKPTSSIQSFTIAPTTSYTIDPTGYYMGRTYKISTGATSTSKSMYKFWMSDLNKGNWVVLKDYSEISSINWTAPYASKFELYVQVRDIGSTSEFDTFQYSDITVQKPTSSIQSFTITPTSSYTVDPLGYYLGRTYKISTGATSTNKSMYKFWMSDLNKGDWVVLKDYSETSSINWTAPYPGKFELYVQVRDIASTATFDTFKYSDITFKTPTSSIQSFTITPAGNYTIDPTGYYKGRTYSITTGATSTNKSMYKFWMSDLNKGNWIVLKDYSETSSINWTAPYAGKFELYVQVKDAYSVVDVQSFTYKDIVVKNWTSTIEKYQYSIANYRYSINSMINYQFTRGTPVYQDVIYSWAPANTTQIGYYVNPINLVNDNYQQFQFLILNYMDGVSVDDLNKLLQGKGILQGTGAAFLEASKANNVNVIYLVSHALLETGNGFSKLATGIIVNGQKVYNMYGIGAYDSDPDGYGSYYAFSQGWFSVDQAIRGGAYFISKDYINNNYYKQNTLYKMRWNPSFYGTSSPHQYATDIRWAYNQVYNIKKLVDSCPNAKMIFDIPNYIN